MGTANPMTTASRRLFAGAAALVFVAVFFAVPLYAVATICTLPCCHDAPVAGQAMVDTGAPPCMPQCSIRTVDATAAKSVRTIVPPARGAVDAAPVIAVIATAASSETFAVSARAERSCRSAARVHVLNSVFRI